MKLVCNSSSVKYSNRFTDAKTTASFVGCCAFARLLNHEIANVSLKVWLSISSATAPIESPLFAAVKAFMKTSLCIRII